MPVVVPLIVAAAPVVARYIASKGIAMAIKKFTKKSITAAKQTIKNEKRALQKPSDRQQTNHDLSKHSQSYGRGKNIGRVQGFVAGAGGVGAIAKSIIKDSDKKPKKPSSARGTPDYVTKAKKAAAKKVADKKKVAQQGEIQRMLAKKVKGKGTDNRINPSDYPVYPKGSKSAKAFREAQISAKGKGQTGFKFEGRPYSTKEK